MRWPLYPSCPFTICQQNLPARYRQTQLMDKRNGTIVFCPVFAVYYDTIINSMWSVQFMKLLGAPVSPFCSLSLRTESLSKTWKIRKMVETWRRRRVCFVHIPVFDYGSTLNFFILSIFISQLNNHTNFNPWTLLFDVLAFTDVALHSLAGNGHQHVQKYTSFNHLTLVNL